LQLFDKLAVPKMQDHDPTPEQASALPSNVTARARTVGYERIEYTSSHPPAHGLEGEPSQGIADLQSGVVFHAKLETPGAPTTTKIPEEWV
jgi:hypothetical protein